MSGLILGRCTTRRSSRSSLRRLACRRRRELGPWLQPGRPRWRPRQRGREAADRAAPGGAMAHTGRLCVRNVIAIRCQASPWGVAPTREGCGAAKGKGHSEVRVPPARQRLPGREATRIVWRGLLFSQSQCTALEYNDRTPKKASFGARRLLAGVQPGSGASRSHMAYGPRGGTAAHLEHEC